MSRKYPYIHHAPMKPAVQKALKAMVKHVKKSPAKVHVVEGSHDYESSTVVGVYLSRESAEAVVEAAYAHKQLQPRLEGYVHEKTDEELAEFSRRDDAWRAGLPFGSDYDSYSATEHEVKP